MTHYLPPQLLTYFEPRPPLTYLPFNDAIDSNKPKTCLSINGVADIFARFAEYSKKPKPVSQPTKQQIKQIRTENAIKRHQRHLNTRIAKYDPKAQPVQSTIPSDSQSNHPSNHQPGNEPTAHADNQSNPLESNGQSTTAPATEIKSKSVDAYKTLFVGRLNYSLTERDIAKEFEYYGPIVSCHLVTDSKTGKSRGYAFIQFASSKDLSEAFKDADGRKIAGRRIVVDVERGRTVKNWKPRRLGGGLGGTRIGGRDVNRATSGRDVQAIPDKAKAASSSSTALSSRGIHPDRERERERERERDHRGSYRERDGQDGYRTRGRSRSPSRHDRR